MSNTMDTRARREKTIGPPKGMMLSDLRIWQRLNKSAHFTKRF
jgi:hypothetical protein